MYTTGPRSLRNKPRSLYVAASIVDRNPTELRQLCNNLAEPHAAATPWPAGPLPSPVFSANAAARPHRYSSLQAGPSSVTPKGSTGAGFPVAIRYSRRAAPAASVPLAEPGKPETPLTKNHITYTYGVLPHYDETTFLYRLALFSML